MSSPCRLLDFCEKPPLPKDIKTSLIPDDISCEILSFVSSVKVFCSTQPCWGWACWQPDTTLTAKKEGETCKQRFALWQGGAIANSHASFASNSSFCRFSSISSSYDSLRKLSCSILASFFSFLIMLFNFLKTLLTAEVSFMVMCSRCECQRQTVPGRATQPFILPPVEEEEEGGWCESSGQVQLVSKDNGAIWVEGNPGRNARAQHQTSADHRSHRRRHQCD